MTPDLIIFDCDGVLVDTEPATNAVIAENLTRHGLPMTAEDCMDLFIGGTMQGVMDKAIERGADLPPDWIDEIYVAMFARLDQGVDMIPGVSGVIAAARSRGIALAVASNGPVEKMRRSLGPHGLFDLFGDLLLSREHHAPKPDPAMLLHAMNLTGTSPAQTVMIDDAASGCAAARAAGVRCLGFATMGQDAVLAAQGAEVHNSMTSIAAALGL